MIFAAIRAFLYTIIINSRYTITTIQFIIMFKILRYYIQALYRVRNGILKALESFKPRAHAFPKMKMKLHVALLYLYFSCRKILLRKFLRIFCLFLPYKISFSFLMTGRHITNCVCRYWVVYTLLKFICIFFRFHQCLPTLSLSLCLPLIE